MCPSLHPRLLESLASLVDLLRSDFSSVRHMSSKCLAEMARVATVPVMVAVVSRVVPLLESPHVTVRQGAVECLACVVDKVDVDIVPYIVLLVVPMLGRMSDQVRKRTFLSDNNR